MSQINIRNLSNENDDGSPEIVGVSTFSATSFFVPPKGSTAERPSDCEPGSIRFNTDTANLEYFRGKTIGWSQFELINPNLGGGTGSNTGLGTRGIIGGGTRAPAAVNEIRFITLSTMGADQSFGTMVHTSKRYIVGLASKTRGVFVGGAPSTSPYGGTTDMEFITHASTGNGTDFGDCSTSHRGAGCADQTRGVFTLGNVSPYNIIDYITIASAGSSRDFGDLTDSDRSIDGSGCSSSTRGIFAGSYTPNTSYGRDDINFITISTQGNTSEFGTLSTITFAQQSSSSNSTRAIFAGGYHSGAQNTIQFLTIATTGNTTDFGDLQNPRKRSQQVSSPTRAVIIGGGIAPSEGNVTSMEKVEILTTGASVDFGTLANGVQAAGYFSNGHGGL